MTTPAPSDDPTGPPSDLLDRLDAYCDLVPRADGEAHEVGSFVLFVSAGPHAYYARPRRDAPVASGGSDALLATDVAAVVERQRALGLPPALEWIHEVSPSVAAAAEACGLSVQRCPLLVLDGTPPAPPAGDGGDSGTSDGDGDEGSDEVHVRLLAPDDPALPQVRAAIAVGFGHSGTATGRPGLPERDAELARTHRDDGGVDPGLAHQVAAMATGRTVVAGALADGAGAVGGGSHRPRGGTTEIVGVAVLPAYRRRGLAGAITAALARQALGSGVTTVFCGAEDEAVARVYERVGFRRVGTTCIAEGPPGGEAGDPTAG